MKIFTLFLVLIYGSSCFAVGWEEISKSSINKTGISVNVKSNLSNGCSVVEVNYPKTRFFEDLGDREFWGVTYKEIEVKDQGWQLSSKGTEIGLSTKEEGKYATVQGLCLSDEDMKFGYLSAIYGGVAGQIPMMVILKIDDYK